MYEQPSRREFVTEILGEAQLPIVLWTVIQFLTSKGVDEVRVEFGFIYSRHQAGQPQPEDQAVPLKDLEAFIERGLRENSIEWNGSSNFSFSTAVPQMSFMLCNDADFHFASFDLELLIQLQGELTERDIKVYG